VPAFLIVLELNLGDLFSTPRMAQSEERSLVLREPEENIQSGRPFFLGGLQEHTVAAILIVG